MQQNLIMMKPKGKHLNVLWNTSTNVNSGHFYPGNSPRQIDVLPLNSK